MSFQWLDWRILKTYIDYFENINTKLNQPLTLSGTQNFPDLKTYCEKVQFKNYDTFLILTASRFTKNDFLLAKKVKSMKKSFFFVRTKIDQDIDNEKKEGAFNEQATLNDIREECLKKLKPLGGGERDVFLISNDKTDKWEFNRLTQAILSALPLRQKESLALTLDLVTSRSNNLLKEKVKILRGNFTCIS